MTKKYEISQEVAAALLDYLQTRPYKDVFQFINALVQLQEIPAPEEKVDEKPEEAPSDGEGV